MRIFLAVLAMLAVLGTTGAWAQAYSGTAGVDSTGATAPVPQQQATQPMPPSLPPVFQGTNDAATAPPVLPTQPALPEMAYPGSGAAPVPTMPAPTAVPGQLDAAALPPDPCAAYINSYDAYAVCQDRVQRLQRMKDARTKRGEAADAIRQRAEERRAAQNVQPEPRRGGGIQRPGQVPVTPRAPMQVQVIPADPAATPATTTPAQ